MQTVIGFVTKYASAKLISSQTYFSWAIFEFTKKEGYYTFQVQVAIEKKVTTKQPCANESVFLWA